jgi:hypothetical protein
MERRLLELRSVSDFRKAYDYMAEKVVTKTVNPVGAIISR